MPCMSPTSTRRWTRRTPSASSGTRSGCSATGTRSCLRTDAGVTSTSRHVEEEVSVSEKSRVLVVANRTAASDELLEAVVQRVEKGPAEFFLVVPPTPRGAAGGNDQSPGAKGGGERPEGGRRRL